MRPSTQQHVAYRILIHLDVLSQSVDLVVVGHNTVLDLALLPHALSLSTIILQVRFTGIRHLPVEDGQSLDSLNEVNGKELVIDGGLTTLVSV